MMKAIAILQQLESEWREYSSNGWYQRKMKPYFAEAVARISGHKLSDHFEDLDYVERRTRDVVRVKSLVAWGREDLGEVERFFNVSLPSWAHEFYQQVRFAVLCFRNPVRILTPSEAVALEQLQREAERSAGLPDVPIRMISFAEVGIEGDTFAFRQNTRSNHWEIAFSPLCDDREMLQSTKCEEWVPRRDSDFDQWLTRLMETDGHPLSIGREDEICYTERWSSTSKKRASS